VRGGVTANALGAQDPMADAALMRGAVLATIDAASGMARANPTAEGH